ncbi:MAG: hypothetical protein SOW08_02355 [Lachnospiraceae bacterium]|nr:hypothetical protein [Lachnospiraceae bacterium]
MKAYAVDHNGNQHCSKRINAGGQNLFHIRILAVQLCQRALASLKYFCEDAPDYHIIAAGSLLGVERQRLLERVPAGRTKNKRITVSNDTLFHITY